MRRILIIGSGKSTSYLLKYLLDKASLESLFITVADIHIEQAVQLIGNNPNAEAIQLDISNDALRTNLIKNADIVVSMLPAHLHIEIAKDCIRFEKHLVTASYVSAEMQLLDEDAKAKGLIFLNEIGVDPGLDHMSAMQILDRLRSEGAEINTFESYTGGLIAPESDDNLWHYKFTWNPRNVVLAGQGAAAKFLDEGSIKYMAYNQLFKQTKPLQIDNFGDFEVYANRDSLKYKAIYGLKNIKTLYRGTIRRAGFCKAWDVFVSLGMTDDSYTIEDSEHMSYRDFTNAYLPYHNTNTIEEKLRHQLKINDENLWNKLLELDLFNANKRVKLKNATPAQILQKILSEPWSLSQYDKDMVVMYHKFGYKRHDTSHQTNASMVILGETQTFTAMAKTVGLPVAIATLAILNGKITSPGVQIPIAKNIYQPILEELQQYGIIFQEKEIF
ncbi:saccharopine dehydrogenase family protein [Tamlana sp. I1]|uniref:saccharopine dehydrogenase family protein n=1 Tax=Tamlana sp. I1 TaxID=2762061 RepID=UPI00188FD43F|nr:saccharopine dehydrogenase C-terminal domain-containing protein [Tamlana sp. I1]